MGGNISSSLVNLRPASRKQRPDCCVLEPRVILLYVLGYLLILIESRLSTHDQVEYDWKERAWAGRKKVKDTWGLVV